MDLTPILTGGGVVVLLATLIGYLLTSNYKDRVQHQEVLTGLRNQISEQATNYDTRLEHQAKMYEDRLAALEAKYESKLEACERRIDSLEKEVEEERQRRVAAELMSAKLEQQLIMLRLHHGESGAV